MEKIENLNLIALRKYACAKVSGQKDWFLKCVECPTLDSCKVGLRARDIVDSATAPMAEPSAFVDRADPNRFAEAAKHPEPAKWLFEQGYYDKQWRANDAWKKWLNTHNENKDEPAGNGPKLRKKARERVQSMLSDNPNEKELLARILKATPTVTASSVSSRLYQWIREYSDILGEYPQANSLCRMLNRYAKKRKTAREAYDDMFGRENPEPAEDEVSVEDFLQEQEATVSGADYDGDAVVMVPEPELPEPATDEAFVPTLGDKLDKVAEEAHVEIQPTPGQIVLQHMFGLKRIQLKERLLGIQKEFEKLDAERADILSDIEALDKTAEMFGMKPVKKEVMA